MLVIDTKTYHKGSGLFDVAKNIFQKTTNSALAKKVINSATTGNLKRAANSAVGKEIQKGLLSGVKSATESVSQNAFQKLGIPPPKKRKRKPKKKGTGKGIVFD